MLKSNKVILHSRGLQPNPCITDWRSLLQPWGERSWPFKRQSRRSSGAVLLLVVQEASWTPQLQAAALFWRRLWCSAEEASCSHWCCVSVFGANSEQWRRICDDAIFGHRGSGRICNIIFLIYTDKFFLWAPDFLGARNQTFPTLSFFILFKWMLQDFPSQVKMAVTWKRLWS